MSFSISPNCLKFSSIAVFMLFLQTSFAQVRGKKQDYGTDKFPEVDAMVTQKQKQLGTDVVVLVWKDTLVYRKELGDFNGRTTAPINATSQWLTAALVLQLVDEGKLSLDDKVGRYLPIFDKYGKSYITLRHCLSHMTGIQSDKGLSIRKKSSSLEEEVESFAKHEIQTNPGTEARYSNIGPSIAARVIEIVTKKKFDLLIRQKLLVPLAMRQTSFSTFDGSAPNPSTGAVSTANDFINFLQMILSNGKFNGKQVLSEASVKELKRIHVPLNMVKSAPKGTEGFGYALGSWVADEGKGGQAGVLAGPGLSGTWPAVDLCRGYACLIFPKSSQDDQKADAYLELKKEMDEHFPAKCQ
jgi:CubicO group peptidase (beta-lactamase class C family)